MDNERNLELIILEVLGCLNEKERESLSNIKETDENFPWKTLAEFQNLTALLPALLKATDSPSDKVKNIFVERLGGTISVSQKMNEPEKLIVRKQKEDKVERELEKVLSENKIDWGALSVSESPKKPVRGFEEVKPKIFSKTISIEQHEVEVLAEENNHEVLEKEPEFRVIEANPKSSSSTLKKYILVSIALLIISVSLAAYLFLNGKPDTSEAIAEKNIINPVVLPTEEFVYNDLKIIESAPESVVTPKVEIDNKPKVDKNILPKAPPKLPDPIEAPLIETKQLIAEEEAKVEDKISSPPPKEVTEITEEPNYFVAVEEMPQPIGGLQGIQEKIKYPEIALRAGVEGKVYVRAFVDETGTVTGAEIVKGIGAGCDEAALDAIQKTKFTPGKQRGKPIKVQITIPVVFRK